MGLGQALTSASTGLHATQSALSLIAGNIANANTPGYVKKTSTLVAEAAGNITIGVRISAVNRELDTYLQRQIRTETSGGSYASTRADYYSRLQDVFGQPGAANALESVYNDFSAATQALATSPDSTAARYGVLTKGQTLAQHLNGMTADIQGLRSDAEAGLGDAVQQANDAMRQIASINLQLGQANTEDATTAVLRDTRDAAIDKLSTLMNVKVIPTDNNKINIFTTTGTQLVGDTAAVLTFNSQGSLSANSIWNADPTKSGTGTILLNTGTNTNVDLIAANAFGSGKIGALVEMRDHILVDAQAQVDQVAAGLASALSDHTTAGTAATVLSQKGFDVDVGSLLPGNTAQLTYTDSTGTKHDVTIMRVDDTRVLPLNNNATPNPNDKVVGVDFSQGMASVIAQISSALGTTGLKFSNPSGNILRVLDDGAGGQVKVNSLSATSTVTSLTSGGPEVPLFLDGTTAYSGSITNLGNQSTGLAGRIAINPALIADPTRLVVYQTSPLTNAGDSTRPNFLVDRLTNAVLNFSPQAGVGTVAAPYSSTLTSYMQQMISQQGDAAANAKSLNDGQQVVVNSLQQRFASQSNVSIDEEMSNLLKLQTAYGANARVMTAIKDMLNQLMQM
jgi:flagellar hook-associated protein 1 FlgK